MSRQLRWVLLLPGVLAAWACVIVAITQFHGWWSRNCSSYDSVPACESTLVIFLERHLISIGAALSATVVVLIAYLIAPLRKRRVAWTSYAIGVGLCLPYLVIGLTEGGGPVVEPLIAILFGLLTAGALSIGRRGIESKEVLHDG